MRRWAGVVALAAWLGLVAVGGAWAAYPEGGLVLPESTARSLLMGPEGPRTAVIQNVPDLYEPMKEDLQSKDLWTNEIKLRRAIDEEARRFERDFHLVLEIDSEYRVDRYLFLLGMRERLAELKEPTVNDLAALCDMYYIVASFPMPDPTRAGLPKAPELLAGELAAVFAVWREVSEYARVAWFSTTADLSERTDLDRRRAGDLLWRISGPGVDPVTSLGARRASLAVYPDTPRKLSFIVSAIQQGYYQAAEEVWRSLSNVEAGDQGFTQAKNIRARAVELESLAGKATYEAGLRRGRILFDFGRYEDVDREMEALIGREPRRPEAWVLKIKALMARHATDYRPAREAMNKASAQVRPRSADFLELAIGLETAGLFTQVQGSGGVSLTSMNQGLERIAALNQEYRKQRPEMGELVAITTDFLQRMIRNPKKGLCGAPLGQYLTRVRKILKADPDNPHALGLELPLAVAVNGIRGALPLMQKPLPTSFHGSTRDRLRLGRARMLLMAAVYLKRYELLDEAHYQLNNLEYERENDATAAEAEMIRGHVWAFRGLKEKWGRPGHHDQALSHYEKALGYLKSEQRPVALNNMLFLQIKSKPPYEVMRTVSRLKRQSLDSYQETLLLPNLTWLEKNPEAETVVSRIRAESGSRAYAMAMVLAGQRAWEQDRKDTARQLWRKAFQGVPLCDQLPLCRNCYMPDEVFVMGDFQWMLEYSVMDGLSMPANIRPEFWLVLPGGTGDGPGGWPSAAQIRGGDKPDTRFRW